MTIKTTAPIPMETLKEILKDEEAVVIIDVDGSKIKENIILVYITNLGLNVRLHFETFESYFACIKAYMKSPMLHRIPQLEIGVIDVLLQYKGFSTETGMDYSLLIEDEEFQDVLKRWVCIIESLSLYALRWYNVSAEVTDYFEKFPKDESKNLIGINFVNLVSYDQFPLLIDGSEPEDLVYFHYFFDEPVFQGSNLSSYWGSRENVIFVIGQAMQSETLDLNAFEESFQESVSAYREELEQ